MKAIGLRACYWIILLILLLESSTMPISRTHTFTAGTTAVASQVNTELDTVYNAYNSLETTVNAISDVHGKSATTVTSSGQFVTNNVETLLQLGTEEHDDLNFYSSGTPTRFTIPSGVTRVQASVFTQPLNVNYPVVISIHKNGVSLWKQEHEPDQQVGATNTAITVTSGVIAVNSGDTIDFRIFPIIASGTTQVNPTRASILALR